MVRRLRQCHLRLTCHTRIAAGSLGSPSCVTRVASSRTVASRARCKLGDSPRRQGVGAVSVVTAPSYGSSPQGHERQRQAPARWTATLLPRWGAPGDDLVRRRLAAGKRGPACDSGPWTQEHAWPPSPPCLSTTSPTAPRSPPTAAPRPDAGSAAPGAQPDTPAYQPERGAVSIPLPGTISDGLAVPTAFGPRRVRQPRPRRLDTRLRGRQGRRGPRAADLLLGAPGQRLRQPRHERVVRARPRRGGPLHRGAAG